MSRNLRDRDPSAFRLITIRTDEARLWMLPSHKMAKLLGGILARYQEKCGILIYAYFFLTNHFHLLIQAPHGNTHDFMANINREIARRVNWKNRRRGKFWSRPYADQKPIREEDVLTAFLYVTTNATNHGLLRDSSEWRNLNSYQHCLDGKDRTFTFHLRSEKDPEEQTPTHTLRLTPLPQFESMTNEERRAVLQKLLEEQSAKIADERAKEGLGFLGHVGIESQIAGAVPQKVKRSPKPLCYTRCAEARREFKASYALRRALYTDASMQFRLGILTAEFPRDCYKPPSHIWPRLLPWTPLSVDHFSKAA